jgi:hypothetical protein
VKNGAPDMGPKRPSNRTTSDPRGPTRVGKLPGAKKSTQIGKLPKR